MKISFEDINGNTISISKDNETNQVDLFITTTDGSEAWFTFKSIKQQQQFIKGLTQIQEEA